VREEFFRIQRKPRGPVLHVLISGGSQGSRTLNHAALHSWPLFLKAGFPMRILHQTGAAGFDEIRDAFARSGIEGEVVPFIADMPAAFADADLVICRSGAGAVSELAAAGKPSILVPFPYAADNHQMRNAQAMERGGASRLVPDADLTGKKLFETVSRIIAELDSMGEAARQFAKPGAAARAADVLEEVARV
jgi:UDP-N-acetylglucosamine--N-acetylmuramyl-(pentapeptide) pyrophosphoryl-undecaprenol N-acetylglucosamine transferase